MGKGGIPGSRPICQSGSAQSIHRHVSIFQLAASINPPTKVENERDVLSVIIKILNLFFARF